MGQDRISQQEDEEIQSEPKSDDDGGVEDLAAKGHRLQYQRRLGGTTGVNRCRHARRACPDDENVCFHGVIACLCVKSGRLCKAAALVLRFIICVPSTFVKVACIPARFGVYWFYRKFFMYF